MSRSPLLAGLLATLALALAASPAAAATEPSSNYNKAPMPGSTHGGAGDDTPGVRTAGEVSECIRVTANPSVGWLFGGQDSGHRWNVLRWGLSNGHPVCPNDYARVQRLPSIRTYLAFNNTVNELYFQRGGSGSSVSGSIGQAHIRIGDLASRPVELSIANDPANPTYEIYPNGKPCASTTGQTYRTRPTSIPGYYKTLTEAGGVSNSGANWEKYGIDGNEGGRGGYTLMLWSWFWTNNTGGGQVRAALAPGTVVERCDVQEIASPMYAQNSDMRIGTVRGVYGRVRDAANAYHAGWFAHSYKRDTDRDWTYVLQSACWAKEPTLYSNWIQQFGPDTGCADVDMADGRIAVRSTENVCYAKDGLASGFIEMAGDCNRIVVSGNRIGVWRKSDGSCWWKDGLYANYVQDPPQSGVRCEDIVVTAGRVGVRDQNNVCWARDWPGGGWVREADNCTQLAMAGNRIGVRITDGRCYAKDGLSSNWVYLAGAGSGCAQIAVSPNRVGWRSTNDYCWGEEGIGSGPNWVLLADPCTQIALTDNRVAVRTAAGICSVKEGPLSANWVDQAKPDCGRVAIAGSRIGIVME